MRIFGLISILLALLVACNTTSPPTTEPLIPNETRPLETAIVARQTATATATPSSVPTEPLVSNETRPLETVVATYQTATATATPSSVPNIEEVCPVNREVTLAALDLDEDIHLLVRPSNSSLNDGVWILDGTDQQPKLIPNTSGTDASLFYFKSLSPDAKWLLFRNFQSEGTLEDRGSIWVVSTDGSEQMELLSLRYEEGKLYIKSENSSQEWILPNTSGRTEVYWSDSDEITIASQIWNASSLDPMYPIFTFNLNSQKGTHYFSSDETAGWSLGIRLGQNLLWNDKSFEVYKPHSEPFFMYDRSQGTSQNIFKWLQNETWIIWDAATLLGFRYWQDASGLVTVVIVQPYGFDIASGMDFNTITEVTEYNEVMVEVTVPPGEGFLGEYRFPTNLQLNWVSPDGYSLGLVVDSADENKQFYIYDRVNQSLHNYCQLPIEHNFGFKSSPDGKYLAWGETDTLVLELATGILARIPGTTMLDWVTIKP